MKNLNYLPPSQRAILLKASEHNGFAAIRHQDLVSCYAMVLKGLIAQVRHNCFELTDSGKAWVARFRTPKPLSACCLGTAVKPAR